jgi:YHS domain-containing protein
MRIHLALLLSLAFAACTTNKTPAEPAHQLKAPAAEKAPPPAAAPSKAEAEAPIAFDTAPAVGTQARCPVSGETFTVAADSDRSEFQGKHFAFCCPDCKPKFDANPAQYAAKK